ncbi:hypothetical protein CKA34_30520 (plasmid) [Rhizobium sp. 11515TR]|nr:hypothetical protein CKA34_30520 [Rhizobium sp. 11515TR]
MICRSRIVCCERVDVFDTADLAAEFGGAGGDFEAGVSSMRYRVSMKSNDMMLNSSWPHSGVNSAGRTSWQA